MNQKSVFSRDREGEQEVVKKILSTTYLHSWRIPEYSHSTSHSHTQSIPGQHIHCHLIKTRETAARIVLEDDIFRAMTRQVQYMAIHCTLKWKNSIYVQTLDKTADKANVPTWNIWSRAHARPPCPTSSTSMKCVNGIWLSSAFSTFTKCVYLIHDRERQQNSTFWFCCCSNFGAQTS